MIRFIHFFKLALRELRKNTMRSGLTMLGVIIGVSSFIAIVGLIESARYVVKKKIYTYGTNAISIFTEGKKFSLFDYQKLKNYIQEVNLITPVFSDGSVATKFISKHIASRVYGTSNDFLKIQEWEIASGRIFTEFEIDSFEKVAIIGNSQKLHLFGKSDPIGKMLHLNGIPFRIIGILESKGKALSGRDFDNIIVIPYTTMRQRVTNVSSFKEILLSVSDVNAINPAISTIKKYFSQVSNSSFDKLNYIKISSSRDQLETAEAIINILGLLLGLTTVISLFVGGINIMNVMHAAVTERTKEIGIRLAVGAKKGDIMSQFIIESSILSSIGGIMGIIFGSIINIIIVYFLGWPFFYSFFYIILSFFFSALVGILFGLFPAHRASRMIPIEAIYF